MKIVILSFAIAFCSHLNASDDTVSFSKSAAPLFKKYCVACHNEDDNEGLLSLESASGIAKGGSSGPALFPGDAKSSRMIRMMTGQMEPKMPPDDMAAPGQDELERFIAWVNDGAKVPGGISLRSEKLIVPDIRSQVQMDPVTALAWSPNGKWLAVARYQSVEVLDGKTRKRQFFLKQHPGKVNSVEFSPDSNYLLAASGLAGINGVAIEWELSGKRKINEFKGHRDVLFSATYSPDGETIATAGYDRRIIVWDRKLKKKKMELVGHNGAVYDLEFSNSGDVLASASGDQTIKLWNVKTGERLDTLGQPLKEQFVTGFHPTQEMVFGAGRDHRIRVWRFRSQENPETNPLLISRFAHEDSLVGLVFSSVGNLLISSAEDRTVKIWDATTVELIATLPRQSDVVFGLAVSPDNILAMGRLDGSLGFLDLGHELAAAENNRMIAATDSAQPDVSAALQLVETALENIAELEPNSQVFQAQPIRAPVTVAGVLLASAGSTDQDLYRFSAKAGQTLILETKAAQSSSLADTVLDVLHLDGSPVPRVKLQAIRDSYFTFRGKDASTSDDFRLHNWEEMELNEYLFCNGEVVKLFLYPRGPDSGFKVYPGFGNRRNYFDTTAVTHALQEPCYIVRSFPPDAKVVHNGLPEFTLNYENDDDAQRKLGRDSKLFFKAPKSGDYVVRVRDARGFQGEGYKYQLTIRSPQPDFAVSWTGKKMKVKKGSGTEFAVSTTRTDGFQGPIELKIENVPQGIRMPAKLIIEAGHFRTYGTVCATSDGVTPNPQDLAKMKMTASATIGGKIVKKDLGKVEQLEIVDQPKIQLRVTSANEKLTPETIAALFKDQSAPLELLIHPGETVSARIVIKRNRHGGDVDLGKEDSGRNLPHGVFIDNIGLNGLRIIKGQGDNREFFITAAKWVKPQVREFHLRANNVDGESSNPVLLKVIAKP